MIMRTLFRIYLKPHKTGSFSKHIGCSSSYSSIADQMMLYINQQCKDQPDQALDILKSGIRMSTGNVDTGRIYMAMSQIEAERAQWVSALDAARSASEVLDGAEADENVEELKMAAALCVVRSQLVLGQDEDAASTSRTYSARWMSKSKEAISGAHALHLLSTIATGSNDAAETAEKLHSLDKDVLWHPQGLGSRLGACVLGHWELSQGREASAAELYDAASTSTSAAAEDKQGLADSGTSLNASQSLLMEVAADALLGQAVVLVGQQKWTEAEEVLGKALKTLEGETGRQSHPSFVPALIMLGHVYSRSARVMYAEGMYREAAKLLGLQGASLPAVPPTSAHPNLSVMLAWRYCQLLSVLDRRAKEAQMWEEAAHHWASGQGGKTTLSDRGLENVFGDKEWLKGVGQGGKVTLPCVLLRRVLVL